MVDIRDVDIAWAAGFMDGEAWIGTTSPGTNNECRRPAIQVAQKVREPLDRLASMFGGTVIEASRRTAFGGGVFYLWRMPGASRNKVVLEALLPYLTVKRAAALEVLAHIETMPVRRMRKPMPRLPGSKVPD